MSRIRTQQYIVPSTRSSIRRALRPAIAHPFRALANCSQPMGTSSATFQVLPTGCLSVRPRCLSALGGGLAMRRQAFLQRRADVRTRMRTNLRRCPRCRRSLVGRNPLYSIRSQVLQSPSPRQLSSSFSAGVRACEWYFAHAI